MRDGVVPDAAQLGQAFAQAARVDGTAAAGDGISRIEGGCGDVLPGAQAAADCVAFVQVFDDRQRSVEQIESVEQDLFVGVDEVLDLGVTGQ